MVFRPAHANVQGMESRLCLYNTTVAALCAVFLLCSPSFADQAKLDDLYSRLLNADEGAAGRIEREIWNEWSKSGSASMDLLLKRGRDAMAAGRNDEAIEHFTALIDHDPDFAEGWNARATAYFNAGLIGPSVADIAEVLKRNPKHFGALSGLAAIYEQLDRKERALQIYRAALAIHPHLAGVSEAIKRLEADTAGTDL